MTPSLHCSRLGHREPNVGFRRAVLRLAAQFEAPMITGWIDVLPWNECFCEDVKTGQSPTSCVHLMTHFPSEEKQGWAFGERSLIWGEWGQSNNNNHESVSMVI